MLQSLILEVQSSVTHWGPGKTGALRGPYPPPTLRQDGCTMSNVVPGVNYSVNLNYSYNLQFKLQWHNYTRQTRMIIPSDISNIKYKENAGMPTQLQQSLTFC